MIYSDETLRHLAVPLGGIGTGNVSLGGEGGLRQWQLFNQINHRAFVPDSFFAARWSAGQPPLSELRILQSEAALALARPGTPLVDDDLIPAQQSDLVRRFGGMPDAEAETSYPFFNIRYRDASSPLAIELEAFTPFVPLDVAASSLPVAIFTFTVRNHGSRTCDVRLAATLQNAVGWDGLTPISGNRCALYGGNRNQVERDQRRVAVLLTNSALPPEHPRNGQMVLAALNPDAMAVPRWNDADAFMAVLERAELDLLGGRWRGPAIPADVPSAAGETWNAGLVVPVRLEPGQQGAASFVIAWWFPNRIVNWLNFGPRRAFDEAFAIGNAYTQPYEDALEIIDEVAAGIGELRRTSAEWAGLFTDVSMPGWLSEQMAAQASAIRSPVCFRTSDERFFGFEGGNGASTLADGRGTGGSCPLNCTHVWNYAQTLSRLFPECERSMRSTELQHMLHPEGFLPHRIVIPLELPQFDAEIGGPDNPALDGMLGCILKVARELRMGAGRSWLDSLWPQLRRLLIYVCDHWDGDSTGLLSGEQPNTYDIAFRGIDPFAGGLWLAALEAAAELATTTGDSALATALRKRRTAGSKRYDELLWNGEYYEQRLGDRDSSTDQFGRGCLSDQLVGQWWAHQLGLGHVLPVDHVRSALRSIVQHNFHRQIGTIAHSGRVFADGDDPGLVLCTWPHGGRPAIPFPYCDEVWTGVEYQVAAHCLYEGLEDEAFQILEAIHQRHSGARRNPYNHVECGDHYVRAMAGWSVLDALAGVAYDSQTRTLEIRGTRNYRGPWAVGTACGHLIREHTDTQTCSIRLTAGKLDLDQIVIHPHPNDVQLPRLPAALAVGDQIQFGWNWSDSMR